NDGFRAEIGGVAGFVGNVVDHIAAIVGDVVRHDALQARDNAPLQLAVPVGRNAGLNPSDGIGAGQFAGEIHARPRRVQIGLADALRTGGQLARRAVVVRVIVGQVRFFIPQVT